MRMNITTTIDEKDKVFCEEKGLKISELLNWAVNEKKQENGDILEPTLKECQRRLQAFRDLSERYRDFIERKGLLDEFLEFK